jgi:hypothetical protein
LSFPCSVAAVASIFAAAETKGQQLEGKQKRELPKLSIKSWEGKSGFIPLSSKSFTFHL